MSQLFYSDDDAEAILKLASRKSGDRSMSREKLFETAAELGITPEAVEEAELAYRRDRQESEDLAAFLKHKRSEFMVGFGSYVCTCAGLGALDFFTSGHRFTWVFWVIFGWGIGILGSFRETFLLSSQEREKSFRRWQRKRERRAMIADGSGRTEDQDGPSNSVVGLRISVDRGSAREIRTKG